MSASRDPSEDDRPPIEVVTAEEIRREYEKELVEQAEAAAEQKQEERQFEVMITLLQEERLSWDDLYSMQLLGVIASSTDFLPCKDQGRDTNHDDWALQYERFLERKESGAEAAPEDEEDEDEEDDDQFGWRGRPIQPSEVDCPLIARMFHYNSSPVALPCIEAQRAQAEDRERTRERWPEDQEEGPPLLDPDDPVVGCELRPCMVMGRQAILGIARGVAQREQRLTDLPLPPRPPTRG